MQVTLRRSCSKMDEHKNKKKGVTKGGQETYSKATAKKENKNPKSNKTVPKRHSKSTAPESHKSRLTAYEEYTQKDALRVKVDDPEAFALQAQARPRVVTNSDRPCRLLALPRRSTSTGGPVNLTTTLRRVESWTLKNSAG